MKKLICLLLALIMTLSVCSGITMAADTVVEVKLRPGRTVDVASAEEFMLAYKEVYEPGSDINRIRLTVNCSLFTAGLRTSGGNDPWMSGYENELCIRMPEGTCLDLNGCTASIRSNQGLDDNGTGKPSGLQTMGTVIDTFGGGAVNLQSITEGKYLQNAIDLAKKYPGIVKGINVSKAMPGAEEFEYVIPAGVALRFTGKPSHLPAKKLTLEPGSTIYQAQATAPGLEGCKAVVLQYVDDADMKRAGSEHATEKVKVEGTVPTYDKVTYKLVVDGGSNLEIPTKVVPEVKVAEPKTINTAADATTEAAVILNPSDVKIWEPRKLTTEENHTLLQNIALAYYWQGRYVQYDGIPVSADGSMVRKHDRGRPEDAAFDSTVYSVCSDYCWKVYDMAYGADWVVANRLPRTRTWSDMPVGTADVVYQYSGPDCKNSKGETDLNKALVEARKVLQPGDIMCYSNTESGHAMMYVGDIFGDGHDYTLHSWGSSHDSTTGQEKLEGTGTIKLQDVDKAVFKGGDKPDCYQGVSSRNSNGFAILRPLQGGYLAELPTKEAMARLQFPRMHITRQLDRYKYTAVEAGEEVPVYLTIENKGTKELTEVPVEEYIPAGTTLVEGSQTKGAKVEGTTLKWSLKIPAGKSITLTYKVKVAADAKLGSTVEFKGGLVGGIASRTTSLQVGGKQLTEAQRQTIYNYGKSINNTTGAYRNLDFVNRFYKEALGVNPGLPKTVEELVAKLTTVKGSHFIRTGTDSLDKMVLPLHFAGMYADTSGFEWARVREFKQEYYEAGDVFVCLDGSNTLAVNDPMEVDIFIYLGDGKVMVYNEEGANIQTYSTTINNILRYNLILTLRPTFGYADLNARAAKTMAFSDVKAEDWFYTYVKDMYEEGIIAGMTDTSFAPKGTLTWGQALKLITLAVGESEQAGGAHWASGYMSLAKSKGWLSKDVDLNAGITRKEFCQVAAKAKGLTQQPSYNPFTDTASKEVMALYNAGVINGMTESSFAPDALLTRAQIAKIIALLRAL